MNYQPKAQAAVTTTVKTTNPEWSDTQSLNINYTKCLRETAIPKYPNYKPAVKLGAYLAVYEAPAT